jgi:hypothetical protein
LNLKDFERFECRKMREDFSVDQWKYIEWLSSPRYTRVPPTVEMLAASIGVDDSTLYRWSRLPGFQDEVNKLARASIGKALPALYGALLREAESGSYQHLQLAMEMAGEYTRKSEVKQESKGEVRLIVETNGATSIQNHLSSGATPSITGDTEI